MRTVNYKALADRYWSPDGAIRTENHIVKLDKDYNITWAKMIKLSPKVDVPPYKVMRGVKPALVRERESKKGKHMVKLDKDDKITWAKTIHLKITWSETISAHPQGHH